MGSGSHPGFRAWKLGILLTEEQKQKFQNFLIEYRARVLAAAFGATGLGKPETRFRYIPEMAKAAKHAFNRSGSIRKAGRVWPLLNVKFVRGGERLYGKSGAAIILDTSRREIRIPFLGVKKATKLVERIAGELELKHKPKFVAQLRLTRDGMGRDVLIITILAFRTARPNKGGSRALILAYDINSRYGVTLVVVKLDGEAKLVLMKRYKPPNHGARRKMAARLQSRGRLVEAARIRMREKKLNNEFVKGIVADARRLVRHWAAKGFTAYILVDKPERASLNGTRLSGTLSNLSARLENLTQYEGAHYLELRASGKYCPVCGKHFVKEERRDGKRIFVCPSGHRYDRDFAASWNLVLLYFKSRREHVRQLLQKLGPRALGAPSR